MQYSPEMKEAILKLISKYGRLQEFLSSKNFYFCAENKNHPRLFVEKDSKNLLITQYRDLNGDRFPDPAMQFLIENDGEWYPVSMDIWNKDCHLSRWTENGKTYLDHKKLDEQLVFAKIWSQKLLDESW